MSRAQVAQLRAQVAQLNGRIAELEENQGGGGGVVIERATTLETVNLRLRSRRRRITLRCRS